MWGPHGFAGLRPRDSRYVRDVRDFYLIGAGFSRAISDHMPLLEDLRDAVLPRLEIDQDELAPYGGNFEQWMSHLSVDQPWLNDSDNYRNRARFLEASRAVHEAIVVAETDAIAAPPAEWLVRLLLQWSANRDTVCSFNYDVLIERCLSSLGLTASWSDLYAIPLASRLPAGSSRFLSTAGPPGSVPSLFKLHGSTSWSYGGPHAPASDRITLWTDGLAWAKDLRGRASEPRYRTLYDDLSPLIVPPTTTKNDFYSNLSLRAQWRGAFQALSSAERLTVIGYSFPPGDLQVRQFVAQATAQDIPITVVDRSSRAADDIAALLRRSEIESFSGEDALLDFVQVRCGTVVRFGTRYSDGHAPVVTHDRVSLVPSDWAPSAEDLAAGEDFNVAQRWMQEALERWPKRIYELHDPWPELSGLPTGATLQYSYVPRE